MMKGRHDEALGVYRRCDHTFKTVFGIKPSAATEHLRDAILSERK
jgi:DNA-binding SARP family transcriptional activator